MKLTIVIIGIILAAGCATAVPSYYGYRPHKDTCCKARLVGPYERYGTVIELYHSCTAQVATIVDYGTCSNSDKGFYLTIDWGDGTKSKGVARDFGPFGARIHTYSSKVCHYYRYVKVSVIHCHKKRHYFDKLCCDKIWKILYFKKHY